MVLYNELEKDKQPHSLKNPKINLHNVLYLFEFIDQMNMLYFKEIEQYINTLK